MAEYPTPDLHAALIGAGLNPNAPETTYVDFGTQLARAQQSQQEMEQNLAAAKERVAQAQIQTRQEKKAEEAGYNPQLVGTMTPDQAVAYLNIILKEKGLDVDEDTINKWAKTLPPVVQASTVEAFASRFARETTRSGQPSQFTTDQNIVVPEGKSAADLGLVYFEAEKKDDKEPSDGKNSAHVPDDGMYQVIYDNQGNIVKFIPGGKEPVDQSLKIGEKDSQFWQREWSKFIKQMNPYTASGRNSVGVAMQSYIRAVRALKALDQEVVTKQVAQNIIAEIGAIYKGGSPDQAMMEETSYKTMYGDFMNKLQSVKGSPEKGIPDSIKNYIIKQIEELNETSKNVVKNSLELAEEGNKALIDHYTADWDAYKEKLNDQLENPNKDIVPGAAQASKPAPSVAAPAMDRLNLGPLPKGKK